MRDVTRRSAHMAKWAIWAYPVTLVALSALLLLAWPQRLGASQAPSLPPAQIDPAAQALLNKTIQALGGTAFLNFKTMSSNGRAFSISDGMTQGFVLYQSSTEYPSKRRLSYGLSKKSKAVTLINNADKGWEMDRYGLVEQSPKEISAWRLANHYSLENLLRLRVREPGTLVQTGGQDFVDNFPVLILDIFDSRQVEIKVYLSNATSLPVQATYRVLNPETHEWDDYTDIYSDYQAAQGIQTPMHIVRYSNGNRVAETFRTRVRYDDPYPAGYFEPGS
ncbi:MAG: hypothetical protein ACRD1I_09010 [Terriglobia bacterium]